MDCNTLCKNVCHKVEKDRYPQKQLVPSPALVLNTWNTLLLSGINYSSPFLQVGRIGWPGCQCLLTFSRNVWLFGLVNLPLCCPWSWSSYGLWMINPHQSCRAFLIRVKCMSRKCHLWLFLTCESIYSLVSFAENRWHARTSNRTRSEMYWGITSFSTCLQMLVQQR